jgi:uncharacterized protein YggT (Ycf19 family)
MHYFILMKIYQGCDIFLRVLQFVLVAYCLMSWVVSPVNRLFALLSRMAQPLIAPFRGIALALVRRGFRIDVSALLALVALEILRNYLLPLLFNWMMTL